MQQGGGGDGGWGQVMQQAPPALPPGYAPGAGLPPPPPNPYAWAKANGHQPTPEELDKAGWAHFWAALASLFCCGWILPVVAPLLAMSSAQERGPFLMFHVNQSVLFQGGLFVLNTVIATAAGILSIFCIGYLLFPLLGITWLIGMIYPIVVGIAAKNGDWAEYPLAGPKTFEMRSPLFK